MSPRRPRVPRVDPALLPQPPAEPDASRSAAAPPSADAPAAAAPAAAASPRSAPAAPTRPAPETVAQPTNLPVETPPSSAAPASTAPAAAWTLRPATPPTPRPAPRRTARPAPAPRKRTAAGSRPARRRAPLPEPVPARQITGRSLLVVAALLAALVLVAPTLRVFLNQQLEVSAAEEDIAERRAQQAQYEERLRLWDDPDYVAQQARDRLDLVMPGETLYTVTGLPDEAAAPADPAPEAVNARLPWVEGLWDSVIRSATE